MVCYPPTVVHMNNGAGDRNVNWVVATFSLASKRRPDYFNDLPAHGHGR